MKKWKLIFFVGSLIVACTCVFFLYMIFSPNIKTQNKSLFLPHDASFEQLIDSLNHNQILKNESSFRLVAKLMKYQTVKPGRYWFDAHSNNYELISVLRRGQHYPVTFTFNNVRTKEQLVDRVNNKFLFSSSELLALLNDSLFLKQYQLNPDNCLAIFIPNTYEFYFDIKAKDFMDKMYSFYQDFWNEKRQIQAKSIGLSPVEVSILASIVEEENYRAHEKAVIAGVYMNRLNKGMLLQADPTVKFAVGDFGLKRILNQHLIVDSPYNTYKYAGLPPGPIRIPESSTIDSVLHYTHHNYLYMCAKDDLSGGHNFAVTLSEHQRNATKYHQALNNLKIGK